MPKQLNVSLAFTADTSKAKAQLQDLQNQLTKFINTPPSNFGDKMASEIREATMAAAELKVHLQSATNVKTGTLDFSKLNQSMKKSNTSISQYAMKLKDLGPEGQKSFMMLAQSIASAEVPIRRSNALLTEMWTTLKNTARWQISSSILHGFMGSIQSAYGYAQDLNESLNNIRIVTGQNIDQMSDFAKEANKAAKALSTTTTEYTNASLIYYQQGLSDTEVQERTDITIKMANVARQSAEVVSDQMTAVWNNFTKSSDASLEHYADVMTALGAATASSTDEIAGGLEKFASIADMIGLSYEYAASALATITATTRQSEDVVGTALKTIFARIQGLSLGETLDDGTNLNKYSEALEKVGISIFEQNGELKDMDNILKEMGSKWKNLGKDQQIALAQTVAGVRQYNQLVSLMDNWDTFEMNLNIANTSEGALDEQAKIYEESWEAASDRVRAALESIYSTLIDDELFIDALNIIEDLISGLDALIDSAGGLKGVISALGAILMRVFSKQLTQSVMDLTYNIQNLTQAGRDKVAAEKSKEIDSMLGMMYDSDTDTQVEKTTKDVLRAQLQSQQELIANANTLSEEEKKTLQILLDQQKARGDLAIEAARQEQEAKNRQSDASAMLVGYAGLGENDIVKQIKEKSREIGRLKAQQQLNPENAESLQERINKLTKEIYSKKPINEDGESSLMTQLKNQQDITQEDIKIVQEAAEAETDLAKATNIRIKTTKDATQVVHSDRESLNAAKKAHDEKTQSVKQDTEEEKKNTEAKKEKSSIVQADTQSTEQNSQAEKRNTQSKKENSQITQEDTQQTKNNTQAENENTQAQDRNTQSQEKNTKSMKLSAAGFVQAGTAVLSAVSAVSMLKSAYDTISDPNMDAWSKLTSSAMSLSMALPMLKDGLSSLSKVATVGGQTLGELASAGTLGGKAISMFSLEAGTATASMAALLPYIGIAVGVIGGLIFVGKELYNVYNQDATTAKDLAQAHQHLAEKSSSASQEVDNLKNAFDGYTSALEKLNDLEPNTDEYVEGLKEVNNQALSLMEKYPELAKIPDLFQKIDEDGNIKFQIDTNKVQGFIADQEKQAKLLQSSSLYSAAKASEAQNRSDITNLARDISSNVYTYTDDGAVSHLKVTTESLEENLGNLAEQAGLDGAKFSTAAQEYAKSLTDNEDEQRQVISQLEKHQGEIAKLQNSTNAAAAQMDNVAKMMASITLGENMTPKQQETYKNTFDRVEKDQYNTWVDKFTGSGISQTSGYNNEIVQEYLKQAQDLGLDIEFSRNNTVMGTDTNRSLMASIDGEEFREITPEELASLIAAAMAQTQGEKVVREEINTSLSGSGISLNESVDTALANDLATRLNQISDEGVKEALNTALSQQGVNQSQIISDFLKEAPTPEEDMGSIISNAEESYDLDADKVEHYTNSLLDMSEQLDDNGESITDVSEDLKGNAKAAAGVAVANSRMNKGLVTLAKDFKDYRKVIDMGNESSAEYQEAVKGISDAMNDVLNLDDVELSQDFLTNTENLNLMEQAANGSASAVEQLREKAATDIITHMEFQNDVTPEVIAEANSTLQSYLDAEKLKIGATFDDTDALSEFNQFIKDAGMTADQVQDYFNALGYQPEVEMTEGGIQEIKHVGAVPVMSADGQSVEKTIQYEWVEQAEVKIPVVKSLTYQGDVGKTIDTGAITKANTGTAKKPKVQKISKKSDVVNRYKEIDDALDDLSDSLDKVSKKSDRLFGVARLQSLREEKELLLQQADALKRKKSEAEMYLKIDKQALDIAAKKYGIEFQYDGSGNIINYTEELTKLYDELAAAQNKMNTLGADAQDKFQEATLQPIQNKIDELKELINMYEQTRELLTDLETQRQDKIDAWQDKNYEDLTYQLELKIDIEEAELQRIEYYLDKMSDDFYSMAESAALMREQVAPLTNELAEYKNHAEALNGAFERGEISQADYIDGLKEARDSIYDQLKALNELDKEMLHYYEDTLDAVAEELSIYTDQMEHLTGVFDHYLNLMEILGKQTDYDAMGNFLQGQADTLEDRLSVAQSNYAMLLRQKDQIEERMKSAVNDPEALELYKKEWNAIVEATNEAQEEVLNLTEEWAEAMKSVIENSLSAAADSLEDILTGQYGSFDEMMTELDRLNARQEEYLTKTNQIYETNKLMRTAAQAVDKTDNEVAKKKLQNFISETQALQENTQLSEYELKIQQAKYDLLLAEIALAEAQNAKSTVRLQRDNEGNFGYVYTADQDKVSSAQQDLEDAENSLYNIALEGQQDYTSKYTEALQQMYDQLKTLQDQYMSGEIASMEEYNRLKDEITNHYLGEGGILQTYSKLYNIAIQTDQQATEDFWASSFGNMTMNTEQWKDAVNEYLDQVKNQFDIWEKISVDANDNVGDALENSQEATEELTDASEELADMVNDDVIPAMEDELDAVEATTAAYADQRAELKRLIAEYERYLAVLNKQIAGASGGGSSGTKDWSHEMAVAFKEGDRNAYNEFLQNRFDKESTGNWTSVDSDRLDKMFQEAWGGNKKAQDYIDDVLNGDLKFTDKTMDDAGFKTGGYTGQWGPDGKLAFVHQKELILNSDDTENMLAAISFVREIVSQIDLRANNQSSFGELMSSPSYFGGNNDTLEQHVQIEASFPNVTDRNQIEEAFGDLVNLASQYANRK